MNNTQCTSEQPLSQGNIKKEKKTIETNGNGNTTYQKLRSTAKSVFKGK